MPLSRNWDTVAPCCIATRHGTGREHFYRLLVLAGGSWAALGETTRAESAMQQILGKLCQRGNVETFNEMFDVRSDEWRGNMPQGLSHLALICAAQALTDHG